MAKFWQEREQLSFEQLERRLLLAADYRIHNIETLGGSGFGELSVVGGEVYYRAVSHEFGAELFVLNPATGSTSLVADLNPGRADSSPARQGGIRELDGKLFFTAYDSVHGDELRMFDPDSGAVELVADISPGNDPAIASEIEDLYVADGKLYFTAFDPVNGREPREFDPATLVLSTIDIYPGADSSIAGAVSGFHEFQGKLYFSANDGIHGIELHALDLANGNVELVEDTSPGSNGSYPGAYGGFIELDGMLYFSTLSQLRVLDPAVGTSRLADAGSEALQFGRGAFAVADGKLYSYVNIRAEGRLYEFDPTVGVGRLVDAPLVRSSSPGDVRWTGFVSTAGRLYFSSGAHQDLYEYDAATDSVSLVAALRQFGSDPALYGEMSILNGALYFTSRDESPGRRLYRLTPETGSIALVDESVNDVGGLVQNDGKLYYQVRTEDGDFEIRVHDPNFDTISQFVQVDGGSFSSDPGDNSGFESVGGKLYFSSEVRGIGNELFQYDPLTSEVSLAADINPNGSSNPGENGGLAELDGKLYFAADSPGAGFGDLWEYDPVTDAARLVADLDSRFGSAVQDVDLLALNGKLYFSARNGGVWLHEYDPATETLSVISGDGAPELPGEESGFTVFNGKLYFGGEHDDTGEELYELDPATGQVRLLADLWDGPGGSRPGRGLFLEFDGRLFFSGSGPESMFYAYDPTTDSISSWSTGGLFWSNSATEFNDRIYLNAYSQELGFEFYVFDPNDGSVSLIADIYPGWNAEGPAYTPTAVGEKLYLSAHDPVHGLELREFDPFTGQLSVYDIFPGSESSLQIAEQFEVIGGSLYFPADDGVFGEELRKFDPRTGRVSLVADVFEGASDPGIRFGKDTRIVLDGRLYFAANDQYVGRELAEVFVIAASDFNQDGASDCTDIDALTMEIVATTHNPSYDLDSDGMVDATDRDLWLAIAGAENLDSGEPYLVGDANLDGVVDVSDFNLWNRNKFTHSSAWCSGDFNSDGGVDASDFNLWNGNKFTPPEMPLVQVRNDSLVDIAFEEQAISLDLTEGFASTSQRRLSFSTSLDPGGPYTDNENEAGIDRIMRIFNDGQDIGEDPWADPDWGWRWLAKFGASN